MARRGVEIDEEGVRAFLQSDEVAAVNKEVAELIMKKDSLSTDKYEYSDLGVIGKRRVGQIMRTENDGYFKELADGKLKKAARSRLGDLK